MAGLTIAEKILSRHAGNPHRAGDMVVCDVDFLMLHDANGPLAIQAFRAMGGRRVFDPRKMIIILDHAAPAPNEKIANIHAMLREFALEQGIELIEGGRGVCHQIMVERGYPKPGQIVLGTDSHTCTYGALGAFATGMGATDMGVAMFTGQQWFRVPQTVRIDLAGSPGPGVAAKDVILHVIGVLRADGCGYMSAEFTGEWLQNAPLSDRLTVANMVVEMGAKCGFLGGAGGIAADTDAVYARTVRIDLAQIEPCVARPHTVDNVCPVAEVAGTPVQMGVIGSCTNGRIEDLRAAAAILKGQTVAPGRRLLILPASDRVLRDAAREGVLETLIDAGATICTPGCGVCVGTHAGVPADGETVIASTNRNFKGRMGNNRADIYLASPQTVAASMLAGAIADPRASARD